MYNYLAVTNSTLENCAALLRVAENGAIEKYNTKGKEWQAAYGMSGIYSGDIECEPINKAQADEIIQRWQNVD